MIINFLIATPIDTIVLSKVDTVILLKSADTLFTKSLETFWDKFPDKLWDAAIILASFLAGYLVSIWIEKRKERKSFNEDSEFLIFSIRQLRSGVANQITSIQNSNSSLLFDSLVTPDILFDINFHTENFDVFTNKEIYKIFMSYLHETKEKIKLFDKMIYCKKVVLDGVDRIQNSCENLWNITNSNVNKLLDSEAHFIAMINDYKEIVMRSGDENISNFINDYEEIRKEFNNNHAKDSDNIFVKSDHYFEPILELAQKKNLRNALEIIPGYCNIVNSIRASRQNLHSSFDAYAKDLEYVISKLDEIVIAFEANTRP